MVVLVVGGEDQRRVCVCVCVCVGGGGGRGGFGSRSGRKKLMNARGRG